MYNILRTSKGWIVNDAGDVLLKNTVDNSRLWLPHNTIKFDRCNKPFVNDINNSQIVLGYEQIASQNLPIVPVPEPVPDEETHSYKSDGESLSTIELVDADNPCVANEDLSLIGSGASVQNISSNLVEDLDVLQQFQRSQWEYNETCSLIQAVDSHYEDMHHPKKRKNFWVNISEILGSQGIKFDPGSCKRKWDNLIRTYKDCKDKKNKTGRGPTRFLFFDLIDAIVGDKPNNSSPHTIDVVKIVENECSSSENNMPTEEDTAPKTQNTATQKYINKKIKKKTSNSEYIAIKKKYYDEKSSYIEQSLKVKREKLDLLKTKIELEQRKVAALEVLTANHQ